MDTETLIPVLILSSYFTMLAIERIKPARDFPKTPFWTAIGLGMLVLALGLSSLVPMLLPVGWIAEHSLLPGHKLGVLGGALIGYPTVALFNALAHRACHHFNLLWRWVHQLHHAPERVDMPGAVFFHPFDIIQNTVVTIAITVFVMGLHPEAVAWTGFIQIFYAMFQHWNVNTPHWLGYLIQRPESHCIHHQRDVHAYNYSDFPLWDIVMGSFRNPAHWSGSAGFEPQRARRYGAMFLGRDVNPSLTNGATGPTA
jgi:sterol desaturase/sphingolipid hydroxylase (fatty acid hydroxylase superfamily)